MKNELVGKNKHKKKSEKEIQPIQERINNLSIQIKSKEIPINKIITEMKGIQNEEVSFKVNEMLPISYSIAVEPLSSFSEQMSNLIITNEDNVEKKIELFVSSLFSRGSSLHLIPSETITQLTQSIESLMQQSSEIYLTGSFITLPHVKTMDPIHLWKGAKISDELIKNKENYYVLTGAVQGGVFLGYAQNVTNRAASSQEDALNTMGSISAFSYISQGAIPRNTDGNMLQTYYSWKNSLLSDKNSGYPIGFKVRTLEDVLAEIDTTE